MPYLSSFGWLYRLSRLNGLRTHQLRYVLGLPHQAAMLLRQDGGFPWTLFDLWLQEAGLSHTQRLGYTESRPYPAAWGCGIEASSIRGCRTCLSFGYHTYLHQLPWLRRCEWHDEPLVTTCVCGAPLLPMIRTLRTHRLLECDCGYDHFDRRKGLLGMSEWPEAQVRRFTETYLRHCQRLRARTELIYPDFRSSDEAYAGLTPSHDDHHPTYRESLMGVRIIDEVGADDLIDGDTANAILGNWGSEARGGYGAYLPLPMTRADYHRVETFALQARHLWKDPPRPIGINAQGISVGAFPLLSRADDSEGYALLQEHPFSHLCVGDRLVATINARTDNSLHWPIGNLATRKLVALALSDIAARGAMHHIEYAASAPSPENGRSWRSPWATPLCLCIFRPRMSIKLGFACGEPPPYETT